MSDAMDESAPTARSRQWIVWGASAAAGAAAGFAMSVRVGHAMGMVAAPFVFLAAVVVAYPFRRGRPGVRARRDFVLPAILLAALLAAREGAFGPLLRLDFNVFHSTQHDSRSTTSLGSTSSAPRSDATSGAAVTIDAPFLAGGLADGLRAGLESVDWPASAVDVWVNLDATDSFCFLPLWKWSDVDYQLGVGAKWTDVRGSGETHLSIEGNVERTTLGVCSRRNVNVAIGRHLAGAVRDEVLKAMKDK